MKSVLVCVCVEDFFHIEGTSAEGLKLCLKLTWKETILISTKAFSELEDLFRAA